MKIANLLKRLAGTFLAIGILSFFAGVATGEDRKGPPRHNDGKGRHGDHHAKPEARPGGSSNGKGSSSSLRERWSKMSEKERAEARDRIR